MMKTAESCSPMHPDKICDRISDAILDECLKEDENSRVAVETMGGHGIITITGEVTTNAYFNARDIAQSIAGKQYGVQTNIVQQSTEIAQGVDIGGAGDQGVMVGYACNDNDLFIPHEVYYSRMLCKHIFKKYPYDGKTQVTLNNNKIETIVSSFQNSKANDLKILINEWLDLNNIIDKNIIIHANPAGDWNIGGFEADTGVTGRKLAVDNYGTRIPLGGGAFSGKDYTKVDRSGAYIARKVAVEQLKENNAKEVYCYLSYAIGVVEPVMAIVIIDGKEKSIDKKRFTLNNIVNELNLKNPMFSETAKWGHFGNNFIWDN